MFDKTRPFLTSILKWFLRNSNTQIDLSKRTRLKQQKHPFTWHLIFDIYWENTTVEGKSKTAMEMLEDKYKEALKRFREDGHIDFDGRTIKLREGDNKLIDAYKEIYQWFEEKSVDEEFYQIFHMLFETKQADDAYIEDSAIWV